MKKEGFDILLCPWNKTENIKTMARNARELNAAGMLLTTWNALDKPLYLLHAAGYAWFGDEARTDRDSMGMVLYGKMGEWTRKLVPAKGDYYTAGFRKYDVDAW